MPGETRVDAGAGPVDPGGEARVGATQADRGRAAFGALRRDARQARDRLGDRRVRQLADVFGRDRLDDAARVGLQRDRALDARADTGDDDFLQPCE